MSTADKKKGFLSAMYERVLYLEKAPLRKAIEAAKANPGKTYKFYRPSVEKKGSEK